MKSAVVVGKFYPPHAGHKHLIETACAQAEHTVVMVADRPEYLIPAKLRREWLQTMVPAADVRIFRDKLDDNDSPGWAQATLKFLGYKPDAVFSSEDYGPRWAAAMGSRHVAVDPPRHKIPCSATWIRNDPYGAWQYLSPPVKGYLALRICLVGAESTGKTTLARALAKHYRTLWVPEYGRLYTEQKVTDVRGHRWTDKEFNHIAKTQNQLEDQAAQDCNKVLICDTDSFATSIWYERYLGVRSPAVERLAAGRSYDLYVLTDVATPFEDDGWRDGTEEIRHWMHGRFVEKLRFWGKDYLEVSGTLEQRLAQITPVVDRLLQTNHRLAGKPLAPVLSLQKGRFIDHQA